MFNLPLKFDMYFTTFMQTSDTNNICCINLKSPIKEWINNNCGNYKFNILEPGKSGYPLSLVEILFENEIDAIFFKLKWL